MPIFSLTLHRTYFNQGFFNVTVDFDRFVWSQEGPVILRLGLGGPEIEGTINRRANRNGTPRIMGGTKLRDWLQKNYEPLAKVPVDLSTSEIIVLYKKTDE